MESLREGLSETSGMDETALEENVFQLKRVLEPWESLLQTKKKKKMLEDLVVYKVGQGKGVNAKNQEIKFRKSTEPRVMM